MKSVSLLIILALLLAVALLGADLGGVCAQEGPSIAVFPPVGVPGSEIVVFGEGFWLDDEEILVSWGELDNLVSTQPSPLYAGEDGSFNATITVPSLDPGIYVIWAWYAWMPGEIPDNEIPQALFAILDLTGAQGPPARPDPRDSQEWAHADAKARWALRDLREPREQPALPGRQDHLDRRDPWALKGSRDCPESRGWPSG
jgi:hypothetical protein